MGQHLQGLTELSLDLVRDDCEAREAVRTRAELVDLSPLTALTKLQRLRICFINQDVAGLAAVAAACTRIRSLDLQDVDICDPQGSVGPWPSLESLELCYMLPGSLLAFKGFGPCAMPSLQSLQVSSIRCLQGSSKSTPGAMEQACQMLADATLPAPAPTGAAMAEAALAASQAAAPAAAGRHAAASSSAAPGPGSGAAGSIMGGNGAHEGVASSTGPGKLAPMSTLVVVATEGGHEVAAAELTALRPLAPSLKRLKLRVWGLEMGALAALGVALPNLRVLELERSDSASIGGILGALRRMHQLEMLGLWGNISALFVLAICIGAEGILPPQRRLTVCVSQQGMAAHVQMQWLYIAAEAGYSTSPGKVTVRWSKDPALGLKLLPWR